MTLLILLSLFQSAPVRDSLAEARQFIKSENYDGAIKLYKQKFRQNSCTPEEYKVYGIARLKKYQSLIITQRLFDRFLGDNSRHARISFERAISSDSNDREALFLNGIFHKGLGHNDLAENYFRRVIKDTADFKLFVYGDAETELAQILRKQKRNLEVQDLFLNKMKRSQSAWSAVEMATVYAIGHDHKKTNELFYQGLETLKDSDRVDELRQDIKFLLTQPEEAEWAALTSVSSKVDFIKRFFKVRDPDPFDSVNTALTQFLDRLSYARMNFSKTKSPFIDDRGLIYIRYGEPNFIFRGGGGGDIPNLSVLENESWIYDIGDGFHFDFILNSAWYELRPLNEANGGYFSYYERERFHPFYAQMADRILRRHTSLLNIDADPIYRRDLDNMMRQSKEQNFTIDDSRIVLPLNSRSATFKSDSVGRIDCSVMVPYSFLKFDTMGGHLHTDIKLQMKVLNAKDMSEVAYYERNERIQTESGRLSSGSYVDEALIRLDTGNYVAVIQVQNDSNSRVGTFFHQFQMRDFSQNQLEISDIQPATDIVAATSGRFVKPGALLRVVPYPAQNIVKKYPLGIYFEIYNLKLDNGSASYDISYTLTRKDKPNFFRRIFGSSKSSQVTSKTHKTASSATQYESIFLDISELGDGEAELQIEVSDLHSGEKKLAQQVLYIID